MYFKIITALVFLIILNIVFLSKKQIFMCVSIFFHLKKLKKCKKLNEFEKMYLENFAQIKAKKDVLKYITSLKENALSLKYKALKKALNITDNYILEHCNILYSANFQVLAYYDKIIVRHKGVLFYGKISFNGTLKSIRHQCNKTNYYFEQDNKIFTGTLILQKNCLNYSGYGEIIGTLKMFKRENGFCFDYIGETENPFDSYDSYILDKNKFLEQFEKLAQSVIYGEEYDFENIALKKIISMPMANHFELKYKVINDNFFSHDNAIAKLCDLFALFGFNIIYNYTGSNKFCYKSKRIIATQNELPLEICPKISLLVNNKNYKNLIIFKNSGMEKPLKNLHRLYLKEISNIESITDISTLMILSLSTEIDDSEKLLIKAVKNQLIDGKLINFSNTKYGILDKNDYNTLLFPIFLCKFCEKYGIRDFLGKRLKYAVIKEIKRDSALIYGLIERIYPSDLIYEHTIKCFEICDFKADFIATEKASHISGYFQACKYKNLVFTLIYMLGLNNFSDMFTQSDFGKFMTFSKGLSLRIKNLLSSREIIDIPKSEKLIIFALAEGVFKDKQFCSTYDFKDFYDFFDYFGVNKGKIKEIEVVLAIFLILGNLYQQNISSAYLFGYELLNLMTKSGEIVLKQKLCYDGESFYFDGENDEKLSLFFYGLLKNYLLGIKYESGNLILGDFPDRLDGERAEIINENTSLKILFKKSGKNRITFGETSYINVKKYPLGNLPDNECIIEF